MKRQPLFDEYEAALLLDGYLAILRGNSRKETIEKVSRSLRRMAENQGKTIDDSYRNFQGISGQMSALECAWTNGKEGAAKTTRLFRAIVCFYRTDPDSFEELLQEAKERSREPEENPPKVAEEEEYPKLIPFYPSAMGQAKKDIIRITIESFPGYCRADEAYEEELTIEPTGIRYYRKPYTETETNPSSHWSYHTESEKFRELFETLVPLIRKILSKSENVLAPDASGRGIHVTYSDHNSEGNTYTLMPQEYKEAAAVIRKMIPKFEESPEVLKG